jgi:lysophospholipase L1-like esterase
VTRARIGTAFLLLASLGASLLIVEAALRLSGRVTTQGLATATADAFDRIPGMFQPGQRVVEQPHPRLRHSIGINSLGYRGPDPTFDGRPIVMCLGDSFTYGSYVEDHQTLPAQLQRAWQAQGHVVNVINAGLGGTTIVDHLEILKKSIRHGIRPNRVLLIFSENDISDLARAESMLASIARNRALKGRPGISQIYGTLRNTALFNLALQVRGWAMARGTANAEQAESSEAAARIEGLWIRYDGLLGQFVGYAASEGISMAFVIFPSHYRLADAANGGPRLERVERLALARDVRVVNLLAALRSSGQGPSELYLLPDDGHPSAAGYAIAARALAREVTPVQ